MSRGEIERALRPSREAFHERFVAARRPVVLQGILDDWPALGRWSEETLRAAHGDTEVEVRVSEPGAREVFRGDPGAASFHRTKMTLAACLDDAKRPAPERRAYLQYCSLAKTLPRLAGDVRLPAYCPRRFLTPALLWLSGAGSTSPLHFDFHHILMAQVVGRKRWWLVPPADSHLVSDPIDRTLWRTSRIDVADPDRSRFPGFDRARVLETIVEPGETIFVPYRWWHATAALDFHVAVSFWWEPSLGARLWDRAADLVKEPARRLVRSR